MSGQTGYSFGIEIRKVSVVIAVLTVESLGGQFIDAVRYSCQRLLECEIGMPRLCTAIAVGSTRKILVGGIHGPFIMIHIVSSETVVADKEGGIFWSRHGGSGEHFKHLTVGEYLPLCGSIVAVINQLY